MANKMNEQEVAQALESASEWSELNGQIQRTFQFDDFKAAMAFVNKVADQAEQSQHHPDILIRYNKVTLTLSTHDAGGITQLDFNLAAEVDAMNT